MSKSYPNFTDSVSTLYKAENLCGQISYNILGSNLVEASSDLIKVTHSKGDPTFKIEVNTRNWANTVTMQLLLRAKLDDYYPEVPALDIPLNLVIEEADTFVFVPP